MSGAADARAGRDGRPRADPRGLPRRSRSRLAGAALDRLERYVALLLDANAA